MPPSAARSKPGPIGRGAGERAFHVAEQGRHGLIAAERGAVDLDERAGDLLPLPLQFVDPPGELRLAGAGRAGQQQRRAAGDRPRARSGRSGG